MQFYRLAGIDREKARDMALEDMLDGRVSVNMAQRRVEEAS